MNTTTTITKEDLRSLLLAGWTCDDFFKMGLYKIIEMSISNGGIFDLATYKGLKDRLFLVSENYRGYKEVDENYKNFNPLADYGYEFLFAETCPNGKNRYIVLFDRKEN